MDVIAAFPFLLFATHLILAAGPSPSECTSPISYEQEDDVMYITEQGAPK